ncbi:ribosome silencing factor [Amphritea sp. 1_MG-2023]|uniref:ribosome silencing factor n=1 Tax=Amphritea sp. 1_MG-2023 TaxID=3062670 RepID=UPI0026E428F0|nr:ribosome silencing factor [Amphritea sp. 1_MG-2023]MDO6563269.1 ribosome silencing factor [Amphritea sp. 1_MG-2023]
MEMDQMIIAVREALDDMKARDIVEIDVTNKSTVTDRMVIASGTSKRHVMSIGQHVQEEMKRQGAMPLGIEGADTGEWVLVDLGNLVVHVMMPDARSFYDLEKLWGFDSVTEAEVSQ